MKNTPLLYLILAFTLTLTACTGSKYVQNSNIEEDDVYFTSSDYEVDDFQEYESQNSDDTISEEQNGGDYYDEYDYYDPDSNTAQDVPQGGITNNYYGDVYNDNWNNGFYNGFNNRWNSWGNARFMNPRLSLYFNNWGFNNNFGWGVRFGNPYAGWNNGFGFYDPWRDPFFCSPWGYSPFYDPWFGPQYGWNAWNGGFWNPNPWGYHYGFNNGFINGYYYGLGNDAFANNQFTYGHRPSLGTSTAYGSGSTGDGLYRPRASASTKPVPTTYRTPGETTNAASRGNNYRQRPAVITSDNPRGNTSGSNNSTTTTTTTTRTNPQRGGTTQPSSDGSGNTSGTYSRGNSNRGGTTTRPSGNSNRGGSTTRPSGNSNKGGSTTRPRSNSNRGGSTARPSGSSRGSSTTRPRSSGSSRGGSTMSRGSSSRGSSSGSRSSSSRSSSSRRR